MTEINADNAAATKTRLWALIRLIEDELARDAERRELRARQWKAAQDEKRARERLGKNEY